MDKKFGRNKVIQDVNMRVKKGAIYGFIGLNGAGKPTCLRLLTGLTKATKGTVELFGQTSDSAVNHSRKRMGALIEGPGLYPHLTAEQNLEIIRIQRGILGKHCIIQTLERVHLDQTDGKKVRNFSLGMKQRLGIAVALLSSPELLILDEPINGLDPVGVVEIRHLLKRLSEEYGVTIIISSHILTEVHQIATHYGVIHHGKLIKQSTREEIDEKCQAYLFLRVDNSAQATRIIEEKLSIVNFDVLEDGSIKLYSYLDEPKVITHMLHKNGVQIEEISQKHDTLEDYFTRLIEEESVW